MHADTEFAYREGACCSSSFDIKIPNAIEAFSSPLVLLSVPTISIPAFQPHFHLATTDSSHHTVIMADIQTSLRQSRITRFFPSTSPPKPEPRATFLHLPLHIRNKIYDEAHVGGNKFIFLNLWAPKRHLWVDDTGEQVDTYPKEYDPDTFEEAFPTGLLLASSQIHKEVEFKLYSENAFAVSLMGTEGLRPLEALSDTALQELRVLIVSLLPCHCLTPKCTEFDMDYGGCGIFPRPTCWDYWSSISSHYNDVWGGHSRPLSIGSRTDKHILRQ